MTVPKWRQNLSNAILDSKLPLLKREISNLVVSEAEDQELDRLRGIRIKAANELTDRIRAATDHYPSLTPWLGWEKYNLLPGGQDLRDRAFLSMDKYCDMGNVAPYFETIATDDATYVASMIFFSELPRIIEELEYNNRRDGIKQDLINDQFFSRQLLEVLFEYLQVAAPGRWETEPLITQLKKFF